MSVKSTIADEIKNAMNSYTKAVESLKNIYLDVRFTDAGKHEFSNTIVESIEKMIDESVEKLRTFTDSIAEFYLERDAEMMAELSNKADYQTLLSAVMSQLPEIKKCSDKVIKARLAPFKNDEIARRFFIDNEVKYALLPEYTIGKASEITSQTGNRAINILLSVKYNIEGLPLEIRQWAKWEMAGYKSDNTTPDIGEGIRLICESFLAYIEGVNNDCSDFDPEKVDTEKAGWELMSSHDYAGSIVKRYGGKDLNDIIQERNKNALEERFSHYNPEDYAFSGLGGPGAEPMEEPEGGENSGDDTTGTSEGCENSGDAPNNGSGSNTDPENTEDEAGSGSDPNTTGNDDEGGETTDTTEPTTDDNSGEGE